LGDSTSDNIIVTGRIDSNFIPDDLGRDLGDISRRWDVFARNLTASGGSWDLNGTDIDDVGDLEIDGDLDHDGSRVGFYGTFPATKQNALLANFTTAGNANAINTLIGILQLYGLVG
jgi:hypothetical protein